MKGVSNLADHWSSTYQSSSSYVPRRGDYQRSKAPPRLIGSVGIGPLGKDELGRSFDKLQTMEMTHGQTLWILSEFGFNAGATPKTFNYYIKSLRRLDRTLPTFEHKSLI